MDAKVTIIVVNWNGAMFLARCLAALMAQTTRVGEIVLVDNASSDGSIEIARQFPLVRIIALAENIGFAAANNLAIKAADKTSDWIAFINPDAFAEPQWLEKLLFAAQSHPLFDAFGSKLVNAAQPTSLDGAGDAYHISGRVWRIDHGAPLAGHDEKTREVFSPCAAAALYRRTVLQQLGGFDEDYFCYLEDVDLGFRLRLAGYRCLYVPRSVVHHVGSGTTGGQHSDFALYHGHRNIVWTFVKDMPGILFWLLLPLHMVMNVASLLWFTLRGYGGIILRAKRDAVLGLPNILCKRRHLQKNRVATISAIWRQLDKGISMIKPDIKHR